MKIIIFYEDENNLSRQPVATFAENQLNEAKKEFNLIKEDLISKGYEINEKNENVFEFIDKVDNIKGLYTFNYVDEKIIR